MPNTAKSLKKISSFLDKGYKIKVGEKSYLLFEKEEDYLILVYLERIFFDLFKNISFAREEKEIRVFFRMSMIRKCLENLQEILFESFSNKKESENPFKVRFRHLWHMKNFVYANVFEYNIIKDLNYWEDLNEVKDLFFGEEYRFREESFYYNGWGELTCGYYVEVTEKNDNFE